MPEEMRPEVKIFAAAMEDELRAHDYRATWKGEKVSFLLSRLIEEVGELAVAIRNNSQIRKEAVDVANFAMFIADVCGDLQPKT